MVHLKQPWRQAALPFCNHPVSSHLFLLLGCAGLEQEAVVLYCELISHRGSWRINAAGCRALAESSTAATAALLSSGGAPGPMQRCVQHRRGGHIELHFQSRTLACKKVRVWDQTPHCLLCLVLLCRSASTILQTVLDKKASGRLCRCIEDAHTGMAQGVLGLRQQD